MLLSEQFYQTEKTGYLNEQFRLFHLKDQTRKEFSYHYHDFHKVVIFISGRWMAWRFTRRMSHGFS